LKDYPKQVNFQAVHQLQKGRTQAHTTPSSFAVSKMASCGACDKFGEPHLQQDHIQIFNSFFCSTKKSTQLEKSSAVEAVSILKVDKSIWKMN